MICEPRQGVIGLSFVVTVEEGHALQRGLQALLGREDAPSPTDLVVLYALVHQLKSQCPTASSRPNMVLAPKY